MKNLVSPSTKVSLAFLLYTLTTSFTATVFAADAPAANIASSSEIKLDMPSPVLSRWNIETQIQAHSVAGPASPWLGISAAYKIFNIVDLGVRGFVPLAHTVDDATYAMQAYTRIRVYRGTATDFFTELEGGENFYDFTPFASGGVSVGALTKITPTLRVGVAGGIEVTNYVIDSIGLENESSLVVYPKVSLIANFNL